LPKEDPNTVILDLSECPLLDYSAVNALDELTKKYNEQGKTVYMYIKDLKSPPFENVSSTFSGVSGFSSRLYQAAPRAS
jgi:MFS superfamily sulfate permease-like transporter